jgi:hypothetical protein
MKIAASNTFGRHVYSRGVHLSTAVRLRLREGDLALGNSKVGESSWLRFCWGL